MADRPERPRRTEVPLPPMPAAWQEPVDEPGKRAPRPPAGPPSAVRGPGAVPTPKPPRMAPPRFAAPPPNPLSRHTVPPYVQQPLTAVVPVPVPQPRPVSSIPYPGLPASAPPMAAGGMAGVAPETHPLTGEPLSDRSSLTAGLLQIFLGAFGAGRLYTGHVAIALLQLMSGWFLFAFTMCAGLGFETRSVWALFWVGLAWPVIDGIVFLGYGGKDSKGRRLR